MGADLHIHILEGIDTEVVKRALSTVFGGKWEGYVPYDTESRLDDYDAIEKAPNIWIGEVSWLKAALFDDTESYIPLTVGRVSQIIGEDFAEITDEVIEEIRAAFELPNNTAKPGGVFGGNGYRLADANEVCAFLEQYIGKPAFTMSW